MVRPSGIEALGSIPWGAHVGHFYRTGQDLAETLVPYFKAGLESHERCLWVTCEPLDAEAARRALQAVVPGLDALIAAGQVEIVDDRPGDDIDPERKLRAWWAVEQRALEAGYAGLRVAGSAPWLRGAARGAFLDYEHRVNDTFAAHKIIAMCSYRVDGCTLEDFLEVSASHAYVLLRRDGSWQAMERVEVLGARAAREEALRQSEQKFASIVAVAGDALICIDDAQRILVFNESAEAIFGYARAEVIGQPVELLMPERFRATHGDQVRAFGAGGGATRVMGARPVLSGRRKGGQEFAMEASISRFALDRKQCFAVALRDVSERVRVEQEQRLLVALSLALAQARDYQAVLETFARFYVPALADLCVLYVVEGSSRRQICIHSDPGKEEQMRRAFDAVETAGLEGSIVSRVLSSRKSVLKEHLSEEEQAAHAARLALPDTILGLGIRSLLCTPLLGPAGSPLGMLMLFYADSGRHYAQSQLALVEDIASRAALAIDNARLHDELHRSARRKDEFLAMLAHELRNPLAPIRASVELLRRVGSAEPAVQSVGVVIDRQIDHMVRLIDDLTDLSRINSGRLELRREVLDLAAVVHAAVETSAPLIEGKGHALSIVLPDRPLRVDGDLVRLSQVISNLLNNAAKYTPSQGRIALLVEGDGAEAVVRVRDNGTGIEREMLGPIFELFTQVDKDREQSQGGLGLGLSLARNLVTMHGGSISAHSDGLGQGSELVVRLPLVREDGDHPVLPVPARGSERAEARASRLRILVVDDNEDASEGLVDLLRMIGHDACSASDGPAALALASDFRPELVFLDIGLPGMSGYEVARALRELPLLDHPMLVALTGRGREEDRRRSQEAGFAHHLTKPVSFELIEQLLAELSGVRAGALG